MIPKIPGKQIKKLPWPPDDFLEVLSYYDGPRIVLQKDAAGKLYIGWWNDEDETRERWVYVGISQERLKKALDGQIPSREIIDHPEDGHVVVYDIDLERNRVQALATAPANVPPESLPLPGAQLSAALSCRLPIAALSALNG